METTLISLKIAGSLLQWSLTVWAAMLVIGRHLNYYFGVGDSLILKFENNEIEELTPECAFKIQPDLLPSRIRSGGELKLNISFALMSDGISANRKRYKEELDLVLQSENWEDKFDQIMELNQLTQFDDMTFMLLRK